MKPASAKAVSTCHFPQKCTVYLHFQEQRPVLDDMANDGDLAVSFNAALTCTDPITAHEPIVGMLAVSIARTGFTRRVRDDDTMRTSSFVVYLPTAAVGVSATHTGTRLSSAIAERDEMRDDGQSIVCITVCTKLTLRRSTLWAVRHDAGCMC